MDEDDVAEEDPFGTTSASVLEQSPALQLTQWLIANNKLLARMKGFVAVNPVNVMLNADWLDSLDHHECFGQLASQLCRTLTNSSSAIVQDFLGTTAATFQDELMVIL